MLYKILKTLVLPPTSLFVLLMVGWLLQRRWPRLGRSFLLLLLAVTYLATTPFLAGDWLVALEIFLFGTLGIYALSAAYAGYGEAPVAAYLRPALAALGVALLWPIGSTWHLGAAAVTLAILALTVVQGRQRIAQAT